MSGKDDEMKVMEIADLLHQIVLGPPTMSGIAMFVAPKVGTFLKKHPTVTADKLLATAKLMKSSTDARAAGQKAGLSTNDAALVATWVQNKLTE